MSRPRITRTVTITNGSRYELDDYTRDICCDCCLVHEMNGLKFGNGVDD